MGYKAEKERIEGKLKIVKRIVLWTVVGLILAVCIFSLFVPAETWKYHVGKPDVPDRKKGEMRVHFLDVGQGDATLIELPDGKVALIDGGNGENGTASRILRYLNALDIDTIDYLIVTHADSDHCGGLDMVLKYKTVKAAYIPNVLQTINEEYAEFYLALLKEKCKRVFSSREISLTSENEKYPYTFSFLYPYSDGMEDSQPSATDSNERSAIVWLDYMGTSALFTGDAPFETEEILMRDDRLGVLEKRGVDLTSTEILKVAHHGSKASTGEEFLQYLNVQTAVISCGKDNEYGHPTEETLARLNKTVSNVYRTDESGNIVITVKNTGEYSVKTIDK